MLGHHSRVNATKSHPCSSPFSTVRAPEGVLWPPAPCRSPASTRVVSQGRHVHGVFLGRFLNHSGNTASIFRYENQDRSSGPARPTFGDRALHLPVSYLRHLAPFRTFERDIALFPCSLRSPPEFETPSREGKGPVTKIKPLPGLRHKSLSLSVGSALSLSLILR